MGSSFGPYGITLDQKQATIDRGSKTSQAVQTLRVQTHCPVAQQPRHTVVPHIWHVTGRSKAMIAHDHDIDIAIEKEEDMLTVWKNRTDFLTTCQ